MSISLLKMRNHFCRLFEKSTVTVAFTLVALLTDPHKSNAPLLLYDCKFSLFRFSSLKNFICTRKLLIILAMYWLCICILFSTDIELSKNFQV